MTNQNAPLDPSLDPLAPIYVADDGRLHGMVRQAAGPAITLYDISCLLRLFAGPREESPNVHVLNRLKAEGLAIHDGDDWAVSEKGRTFCEGIRALPMPVQQWRMP